MYIKKIRTRRVSKFRRDCILKFGANFITFSNILTFFRFYYTFNYKINYRNTMIIEQ